MCRKVISTFSCKNDTCIIDFAPYSHILILYILYGNCSKHFSYSLYDVFKQYFNGSVGMATVKQVFHGKLSFIL